MKVGGQILWSVTPICETSQIYCLMGRRHMKDVLGNHVKDQSFRLVHWLSITQKLQRTSQESINLERKYFTWIVPWIRSVRGRIWKGDILVADIEESETMDASEIFSKSLNAKEVICFKKKWKIHISSRRWTNKICWRRSGTENIHLDTGPPNSRRRSKRFSWRIRRVSTSITSRLISGCR